MDQLQMIITIGQFILFLVTLASILIVAGRFLERLDQGTAAMKDLTGLVRKLSEDVQDHDTRIAVLEDARRRPI